jgi:RNA polymerase sigma-70 factor (ECF subfamily)
MRAAMEKWDWTEMRRRCVLDARGHGLSAAEAEDAAQETLLRAWRAHEQCRTPEAPEPWVRAIGRHEALRLRAARRQEVVDDELAATASAPDFVADAELRVDLARAFSVLSPVDQALLAARYVLGLGQTEIARLCDVPGGTAAIRLHRARRRLRVALADEHEQQEAI